jgi:hypothetical protein
MSPPPPLEAAAEQPILVIEVDCKNDVCVEKLVQWSSLTMYDEIAAEQHRQDDAETADFVKALDYFADWDNDGRLSYVWRDAVLSLLRSPLRWAQWRRDIIVEGGCFLFHLFESSQSKLFCFWLCVAHCGLEGDVGPLMQKLMSVIGDSTGTGTGMDDLPEDMTVALSGNEQMVMDLISGLKLNDQDRLESFRRLSSRVGLDYEALVPSYTPPPEGAEESYEENEGLIYRPSDEVYNSDEIDQYLLDAAELVPIRAGLLADAVRPSVSSSRTVTTISSPRSQPPRRDAAASGSSNEEAYSDRLKQLLCTGKLRSCLVLSVRHPVPTPAPPAVSGERGFISTPSIHPDRKSNEIVNTEALNACPSVDGVSSPSLPSTAPAITGVQKVALVQDGKDTFPYSVSLTDCKPKYLSSDVLLSFLYRNSYDRLLALKSVQELITSIITAEHSVDLGIHSTSIWTEAATKMFFHVAR